MIGAPETVDALRIVPQYITFPFFCARDGHVGLHSVGIWNSQPCYTGTGGEPLRTASISRMTLR
jgi:hypothetical protein